MSLLDLMKLMSDPEAQEDLGHTLEYYRAGFDLLLERAGITQAEIQDRIEKRKAVDSAKDEKN